jgi:hypothetical protein
VTVSDFVTPQYFMPRQRRPGSPPPTHHVGEPKLPPFHVLPGGYFTYFDVGAGTWRRFPDAGASGRGHEDAAKLTAVRAKLGVAPRGFRRLRRAFDDAAGNGDVSGPLVFDDGDDGGNGGPAFPS